MDNHLDSDDAGRQTKRLQTHQLPEDIIMEILLRLPVQSVIRFRCVSKSWYLLLTSSDFSTKHLQHTRRRFYLIQVDKSNEPYGISRPTIGNEWDDKPRCMVALAPDDDLDQFTYIDHPNPLISRIDDRQIVHLRVIGSVDGLFCISLNHGSYIIMWNPATRQSYQLPSPGVPTCFTLGLGRYQDNGYKVVKVVFWGKLSRAEAEVYDSYSNLWHKIADTPSPSFLTYVCTIANGVPYWLSYSHSIIWFDPIHDTFGRMKLPVGLFELNSNDRFEVLGVIRGELAVLVVKFNEVHDMTLDVWMMDQRHGCVPISWTKQFRVDSNKVPRVYCWLTCWKDGELVFQTDDGLYRHVCLYDYWRDETKIIPEIRTHHVIPDEVFLYEESLISPHPSL